MASSLQSTKINRTPTYTSTSLEGSCATESIRLPGSIQRHGFLLGFNDQEQVILASENSWEFLALPIEKALGAKLEVLFEKELFAAIHDFGNGVIPQGLVTYLGAYQIRHETFSVLAHCVEDTRIVEFERQDRHVGAEMMNGVITNFVGRLSRIGSPDELYQAFTEQFAALTGFDRVLLYTFDQEGHGTVLNEMNNGALPSYLGLHFPGTDIPVQARELYLVNTVRIIPDATYTPSQLRWLGGHGTSALDLSISVLRSVSPVHLEYMRNMGTISSMSVSIVSEGRLWGLISGHHASPRTIPYLVRSACDMLAKIVGTQLTSSRASRHSRRCMPYSGGCLPALLPSTTFCSLFPKRWSWCCRSRQVPAPYCGTGKYTVLLERFRMQI